MTAWFTGLDWARPWAALALVVPAALWLLARRRARPLPLAIGTFALWQAVPRAASSARPRRFPPLDTALLIFALVAGVVALAGPRRAANEVTAGVRVVVDRSPSMYLEQGSGSRLDAALALLERGIAADAQAPLDIVEWVAPAPGAGDRFSDRLQGGELKRAWSAAPEVARAEPRWERYDDPRTIWLTDRVPTVEPEYAGLVASGGGAVPGVVSTAGGSALWWDGRELAERPGGEAPAVRLDPALPAVVADLVRAWAQERGVRVLGPGPVGASRLALSVTASPGPDVQDVHLVQEGWRAAARAGAFATDLPGAESWLVAQTPGSGALPVVRWRSGRVDLALVDMDEPAGDPGFFVVSWSRLLDRAVAPAPEVVTLAERADAGPSLVRPPRGEPVDLPQPPRWPLVAVLSAVATALAALALLARRP